MKKILSSVLCLFLFFEAIGQNLVSTQKLNLPLDLVKNVNDKIKNFNTFTLDEKTVFNLYSQNRSEITFDFLSKDFGINHLQLEYYNIYSRDAIISMKGETKEEFLPIQIKTFKGFINSDSTQWARFTFTKNSLFGYIHLKSGENIIIEPLIKYLKNETYLNSYVYYKESDYSSVGICGNLETNETSNKPEGSRISASNNMCRIMEVALESDYEWYLSYLSNLSIAQAQMTQVINTVDQIYTANFNLKFKINYIGLYNTPTDPYPTTSNPYTALDNFRNYWNTNKTNVKRDLAHLFTGKSLNDGSFIIYGNSYGAVSPINTGVLCNNPNYSYSFTTYIAPQNTTCAHEIGHNFSAIHDASCVNYIMCQGNVVSSTFSPNSFNIINNRINNINYCFDKGDLSPVLWDGVQISANSLNSVCKSTSHSLNAPGDHIVNWSFQSNSSGASISNILNNGINATVFAGSNNGGYTIKGSKTNLCGTFDRYFPFNVINCSSFKLFPNPALESLNVEFYYSFETENIEIKIYNSKNNLIETISQVPEKLIQNIESGNKTLKIDVSNFERGEYFLVIEIDGKKDNSQSVKFLLI